MRVWLSVILALCCFPFATGCGGSDEGGKATTSSSPPTVAQNEPAPAATTPAAPAKEEPPARFDRKGRRLPTLMVGGGTGGAAAQSNPNTNNNPAANPNAPAESDAPFTATTPENALFPQPPGSGNATAGFGGALFPVSIEGLSGGDMASIPEARPKVMANGSGDAGAMNRDATTGSDALMKQAIDLFAQLDKENEAMNALYAHVIVNEPAKEEYPIRWFPGLAEPRVAFRWGIGILYSEPSRGFEGRHPVVGDAGDSGSGGGGGGAPVGLEGGQGPPAAGAAASGKYANVDVTRPDGVVLYYSGDVGEQLIDRLNRRRIHREAFYGAIMRDIPLVVKNEIASTQPTQPTAPRGPAMPIGSRRRNRNLPTLNTGGGGPAQAPTNPNQAGRPGGAGLEPGSGPAPNNSATGSSTPTAPASVLQRATASGASGEPDDDTMGTVIPGVMLVGVGHKKELVERARENGLDALFLITVRVSKSRAGGVSSITNLKIVDIKGERDENLYNGKSLKNTDDADDVDRMLDGAFDVADQKFKASDLPPNLKPEHVASRVQTILDMKPKNPLPYAVEIVDWHMLGMIDDQVAIDALNQLFQNDQMGEALLSPDEAERLMALKPYLKVGRSVDDDL